MGEGELRELLVTVVARLVRGARSGSAGAASPIPASALFLANAWNTQAGRPAMRIGMLGSRKHRSTTYGGRETFDIAAQGRLDVFFLSGGQIDGAGNCNLMGIGTYPDDMKVRFPGTFGSAYLYHLVPKVILFREEHSRRVLVPKVDFITAPGVSPANVYRPGGPIALVTPLCLFAFDKRRPGFRLESVHPGRRLDEVRDNTGFAFEVPDDVPTTAMPTADDRALMRARVAPEVAEVYPDFAAQVWGYRAAAESINQADAV